MSPELRKFLNALATWVQDGCPDSEVFDYQTPICCVPLRYAGFACNDRQAYLMRVELQSLFEDEYGCTHYPFGVEDWDASNDLNDFYSPADRNLLRLEFLERYL